MADNQLKGRFREPEDILSSAESARGVRPAFDAPAEEYQRSVSSRASGESVKVISLMLGFIILAGGVAGGWFFFPKIKGMFVGSVPQNTSVPHDERSVSDVTQNSGVAPQDSDLDGLPDIQEEGLGLSVDDADTDNDALSDKDEVLIYATDPRKADTDGDSFLDGDEVRRGFDPNGGGRLDDIFRIIPKEE